MKAPFLKSSDFKSFDAWRAWINMNLLHMGTDSFHGDRFFAHMETIETKDMLWSQGLSMSTNLHRQAEHMSLPRDSRLSGMYCLIMLHSYTPRSCRQYGREGVIGNHDLVLLDVREAFHIINAKAVSKSSYIFLNPAVVDAWLPNASDLVARRIDGRVGWGRRLSSYLSDLSPATIAELSGDEHTLSVFPEHIASLLRNAMTETSSGSFEILGPRRSRWLQLRNSVIAWLQENLGDADLTMDRVALAFHVSTRQLHRIFSMDEGSPTLLEILQKLRMERAGELLADSKNMHMMITDVGIRCGIPSTATFHRLFLRRFGMTPAKYRSKFYATGLP